MVSQNGIYHTLSMNLSFPELSGQDRSHSQAVKARCWFSVLLSASEKAHIKSRSHQTPTPRLIAIELVQWKAQTLLPFANGAFF